MSQIQKQIDELVDRWGYLEISIHPHWDQPYSVRNHTDEGLGHGDDPELEARGETLEEAIERAINEDYFSYI